MEMYLGGPEGQYANWITAKKVFQDLLQQRPTDGPTRTILDVIEKRKRLDGNAPQEWKGHRCLEEK
jgi:hypothetical protein